MQIEDSSLSSLFVVLLVIAIAALVAPPLTAEQVNISDLAGIEARRIGPVD